MRIGSDHDPLVRRRPTPAFQERCGYPPLTAERKAKIFGRNAARVYGAGEQEMRAALSRDPLGRARREYVSRPSHVTYGPRTRRELLALHRALGGVPG